MTDSAGRAMMAASEDFFEEASLLQRIVSYLVESLKILKCSFMTIPWPLQTECRAEPQKLVYTTSFKYTLEQMLCSSRDRTRSLSNPLASCLVIIVILDTRERKPDRPHSTTVKLIYLLVTLLGVTPVKHAPLYKLWNVSWNTSIWDGDKRHEY